MARLRQTSWQRERKHGPLLPMDPRAGRQFPDIAQALRPIVDAPVPRRWSLHTAVELAFIAGVVGLAIFI